MVEESRREKSFTLKCTVCHVSDVRLISAEQERV
jgi:hypothetical protein